MPRIRTTLVAASLAAGALLLAGNPARADDPPGKQLFTRYCGSCHGPDGKGDGMLSGVLKQKPADLVQYARTYILDKPHITGVMLNTETRRRLAVTQDELVRLGAWR